MSKYHTSTHIVDVNVLGQQFMAEAKITWVGSDWELTDMTLVALYAPFRIQKPNEDLSPYTDLNVSISFEPNEHLSDIALRDVQEQIERDLQFSEPDFDDDDAYKDATYDR